jgi:hypothetical protein
MTDYARQFSDKRRKSRCTIRRFFEIHRGPSAELNLANYLILKPIDYDFLIQYD